jgi:hypothetical protein
MRVLQPCLTPHFQTLVQFNNYNPTSKSFKMGYKLQTSAIHNLTHKGTIFAAENIRINTLMLMYHSISIFT